MKRILFIFAIGVFVVVLLGGLVLLSPKYQFFDQGRSRCNKITGKVEYWVSPSVGWTELKTPVIREVPDVGFVPGKK